MSSEPANDDGWSDPICNADPLRPENDALFRSLWRWLAPRIRSAKAMPQVTALPEGTGLSFHDNGLIGIDESQGCPAFPLGAVMLEELLHYATKSDRRDTSADFSPEFLQRILELIVAEPRDRADNRAFQSLLI